MDADGIGRKTIDLPEAINYSYASIQPPGPDIRWVSPDGHWLAFHTGSAGSYGEMPAEGTSDLTLNLLDLTTGEQQAVTPLLSNDYPNNLVEAAEKLNDPDISAQSLFDAFINGITESVAWSPDGRYLAFAGQMDGLSSDLYVYDVNEKTIRRLSSGDQELQWIEWSPDGKWILHSSVFFAGVGMTYDIYAASLESSSVRHLSTNIQDNGIESWLNSHQYFEFDGENVVGLYGLRLVDIDTGKITKVWDETFSSYAVDKSGKWVAILDSPDVSVSENGFEIEEYEFVPAIYLVNLTTLEQSRVEALDNHTFDYITSAGLEGREFALTNGLSSDAKTAFLSTDGTVTQSDLGDVSISVSPSSDYWLGITTSTGFTNQKILVITGQEVKIFSADNTLIKSIPFFSIYNAVINNVIWRPDSSGLFLVSGTYIFSMDIPAGDIKVVETNLMNDHYNLAYAWIGSR
jgi:dipeptidyl aminopeptidase/acylaminoacyl peptidase